jgi:hypothetical protein
MNIPARVINVNSIGIMLGIPVITDQTILANQPDLVLHDNKEKTYLLIEIVIPDDSNINIKETEKIYKYKDLALEVAGCEKRGQKLCQL